MPRIINKTILLQRVKWFINIAINNINMKSYLIITLIAYCNAIFAKISILSTTGSSSSTACNGSFTVRATGTAGPFTIPISATQSSDAITLEGVKGDFLIDGICDGSYRLRVFSDSYISYAKEME
jgi:hypothetical protein